MIDLAVVVAIVALAAGVVCEAWYRGYRHGFKEATDEMRVELDKALKLGKVVISSDLTRDPQTADLLRHLRVNQEN